MPYQRSCQRKLGELTLLSEERAPNPYKGPDPLQRILSGVLELDALLAKCREVREACWPDRGFIRVKVSDYYATGRVPERFAWHALDTNSHGDDERGYQTVGRLKSGSSYKRPPIDLCAAGYVPILWGYETFGSHHMLGSLSVDAVKLALAELEVIGGARPTLIEVRVEMVWLKPDHRGSKRVFMSWAAGTS